MFCLSSMVVLFTFHVPLCSSINSPVVGYELNHTGTNVRDSALSSMFIAEVVRDTNPLALTNWTGLVIT